MKIKKEVFRPGIWKRKIISRRQKLERVIDFE